MTAKFNEKEASRKIKEARSREAEELSVLLSEKYGLPYTDLSVVPISIEALSLIPESVARSANIAIFQMQGEKDLEVAMLTPNNEKINEILSSLKKRGFNISLFITSKSSLEKAWERYKEVSKAKTTIAGSIEVNELKLNNILKDINSIAGVRDLIGRSVTDKTLESTSEILEIVIAGALATSASDIHIEPEEKLTRLRFRLDGVLQSINTFNPELSKAINSRIKLTSGLKLNIKQQAQDGRFSIKAGKDEIEIRTSVMPGNYGESIVLRILNPNTVSLDMNLLGMDEKTLNAVDEMIKKPNGMLLNTGPTGSGKTTTLYSFLKTVNRPGIKILTIEDPIEYHLAGVVQTQVRKGYGFLEGLRSGLRQDPDIIMVGEIRDNETAKIAVNSALTGHLVFSTLHTNNAAGTFPRLLDLGINVKVLGDALNVAMAQRLLRKLCDKCKKESPLTSDEKRLIAKGAETIPEEYKARIPDIDNVRMWKAVGCDKCNETGYKGRTGIFEVILMDRSVTETIWKNPNEQEIWAAARSQGFLRMKEHGIIKLLDGVTDLTELKRVVDLSE